MFSFSKNSKQAQKKKTGSNFGFKWRAIYTWILVIVPVFGGISYLVQNHTFLPIKTIQLSGVFKHIDQQEIEKALRPFVGEGFFSLDIQNVRNSLRDKPWAESVSIRRLWPDRVMIQIVEKKPLARWDNDHFLSDKAEVFAANTKEFNSLTKIYNIDSRGAVNIDLTNGFKIKVGRDNVDSKIERLVSIYAQQIRPRRNEIQQLDLRYSNGFTIAWKKEALIDRDEASLWRNNNV